MRTLVIDASTTTLFVGALEGNAWLKLIRKDAGATGALEILFDMAAELFKEFPLENFARISMCEGPGRLMSLRVAAVAGNEWCAESKRARVVYNSLQLASLALNKTAATELRTGTFAVWKNEETQVASSLSEGATLITPHEYAQTMEKLPSFAEKLLRPTEFFDPPMFAPSNYVMAKPGAISRESGQSL